MNSVAFHVEAVQCLALKIPHPHLAVIKARPKKSTDFHQSDQIISLKEFKETRTAHLFLPGKRHEDSSLHAIIIPMTLSIL